MEECEDNIFLRELQQGNKDALRKIYMKYRNFMLTVAINISNNKFDAEDIVHDAFVSFAKSAMNLQLKSSLKGYLAICVMNKIRGIKRHRQVGDCQLDDAQLIDLNARNPEQSAVLAEELHIIARALARLPYKQRLVVILHAYAKMTIREIAQAQGASIHAVKSQYKHGLNKLRSQLNGEILER